MSSERKRQPDPTSVDFAILDLASQTLTVIQTEITNGFPKKVREDWV